jgi:hypothetical protein
MFVGLMELVQGIAAAVPIIEGAVPFQTTDDLKTQVLDTAAEGGGGKPGVYQEITGWKALGQGGFEHLQGQGRFGQFLGISKAPGQIPPDFAGLGLFGLNRGGLREMVAEVYGIEVPGRQQSQGQDFIAFDGFALGVVIDETQVFQAFAPLRENGAIKDQAVVPGGPGPMQPLPEIGEEAPIKGSPTPFGLLEAVKGSFLACTRDWSGRRSKSWTILICRNTRLGRTNRSCRALTPSCLRIPAPVRWLWIMQHGKQFLDPQLQIGPEIFQGRFDLPLKASDFPVMQGKAPFVWFLLMITQS